MEDNATETVVNGDGHNTCGAVAGRNHGDCLTGGMDTGILGGDHIKQFHTHALTGAAAAGLGLAVLFGNGVDHHTGADLTVLGVQAIGGGDEDVVIHIQQSALDLDDGGVIFLGGEVAFLQNGNLLLVGNADGADLHGMNVAEDTLLQNNVNLSGTLAQSLCGLLCAGQQAGLGSVHSGGHDGAQALVDPHRGTCDDGVIDGVNLIGDHVDGMVNGIFRKNFRVVRAGGNRLLQNTLANISCNHVFVSFLLL